MSIDKINQTPEGEKKVSKKSAATSKEVAEVLKMKKRDKDYYENKENVLHDLQDIATKNEKTIAELIINDIGDVCCRNGEVITWNTYLLQAGVILGLAANAKDAGNNRASILKRLKQIVGVVQYPPRDKEYYENKENLLYDLTGFALNFECSIYTLAASTLCEAICKNGEKLKWSTYLRQAGMALGLSTNADESTKHKHIIFKKLRDMAGIVCRDKEYYENKENVLHDLQDLATKSEKTLQKISTKNEDCKLECMNGETVTRLTYLIQAGVALGYGNTTTEASKKQVIIIERLKKIAGIVSRDKEYYENKENVLHDLQDIATKNEKTVWRISTGETGEVCCANGEIVKWETYILNAGVSLGYCDDTKTSYSMIASILTRLKNIAGIVSRDKEYYENKENVLHDLQDIATKNEKTIEALKVAEQGDVNCLNGEIITRGTYISNAGVALGFGNTADEVKGKRLDILKKLKQIINIEMKEYSARDKEYYENKENVLNDLQGIATKNEKTIEALTTIDIGEVLCKNGEIIKRGTYLAQAGVALGVGENIRETNVRRSEILKILKQRIGIEIKEYAIRDKAYYENQENLLHDLQDIATKNEKTIAELLTNDLGEVSCKNGEIIIRNTYLLQAGVVLGFGEQRRSVQGKKQAILNRLKEIVGIKNYSLEKRVEIINPLKYRELAKILGRGAMMEIFLAQHPEYKDIPFDTLQKIVSDYLGKVAPTGALGGFPSDLEIEDIQVMFEVPALRETLLTAVKTDYLHYLIQYRKENGFPKNGFKEVYVEWCKLILPKIQHLYPDMGELMEEVKTHLYEIFDHTYRTDDMIEGMDDAGREFPGFEQKYNIAEFLRKKRFLVADEMGLGKTATAICAKEYIKQEVKTAMVICPANLISTWVGRLSDDPEKEAYFKQGRAPKVLVIESKKDLESNFADYDYVIMSTARLNDDYVSKILEQDYQMLISDEVHEVKNMSSGVWSKNLIRIADKLNNTGYVMTLSGTPIPNTIKDIAIHMKLLYPHEFDGLDNRDIVVSMMVQDKLNVGLKLRNKMSRKRLTDWIPMPEKQEEVHYISPSEFEVNIMNMIKQDESQSAMEKIYKFRKLHMAPKAVNSDWYNMFSAKMLEVANLVAEKLKKNDKVMIVFNDLIQEMIRSNDLNEMERDILVISEGIVVDYIKSKLKEAGLVDDIETLVYHGEVNQLQRQEIQWKINNEAGKKLLFLSGNTARVGIDLSGIESVIVYNHPWTKSDLDQQISRVYRVGLRHNIDVHHMITKNSIEEGIWNFMHEKDRVVRKLIDGTEILTEEEKKLLMSEDVSDVKNHHPDQEFAQYYFTQKEFLYDQFYANKGIGEEKFVENLNRLTRGSMTRGERYADVYDMLGRRNYQFNANRVNSTIIENIIRLEGGTIDIHSIRILDMASANQVLSKTVPLELKPRIVSNDINMMHFPSGEDIEKLLSQDAYTNYNSTESEYMYGSMSKTLYDDESFDIINNSLAWHYTGLDETTGKYDRILSLIEANRVLKQGGYMIINEVYSLEFAEREKLVQALALLGFEIVESLSGLIESQYNSTYKSNILTLKKIGTSQTQEALFSKQNKKILFQGLKFNVSKLNGVNNQSKILEQFTLNGRSYAIDLNTQDQNLKTEEENAFELIKSLKQLYRDENSQEDAILNVPEMTLHNNGMFSFMDKDSSGKKVRRVARKLSDGSFIFVN